MAYASARGTFFLLFPRLSRLDTTLPIVTLAFSSRFSSFGPTCHAFSCTGLRIDTAVCDRDHAALHGLAILRKASAGTSSHFTKVDLFPASQLDPGTAVNASLMWLRWAAGYERFLLLFVVMAWQELASSERSLSVFSCRTYPM